MFWRRDDSFPVWDSGLVTVQPPLEIVLPRRMVGFLQEVAAAVKAEFALFLAAGWKSGRLVVSDWFCPRQTVTQASLQIEEEPPAGFEGVLHSHPPGCRAFSDVDVQFLNANFAFSVLYLPPTEFPSAVVHLPLEDGRARIAVEARAVVSSLELEEVLVKIKRKGGEPCGTLGRAPGAAERPRDTCLKSEGA